MKVQKLHWDSNKQFIYEYDIPDEEILNRFGSFDLFKNLVDAEDLFCQFLKNYESDRCYVSDTYQIPSFDDNSTWETSCHKIDNDCINPKGELLT